MEEVSARRVSSGCSGCPSRAGDRPCTRPRRAAETAARGRPPPTASPGDAYKKFKVRVFIYIHIAI